MERILEYLWLLAVLFGTSALCGAGLMLGTRFICELFKWAPVNITTNVYNYRPGTSTVPGKDGSDG